MDFQKNFSMLLPATNVDFKTKIEDFSDEKHSLKNNNNFNKERPSFKRGFSRKTTIPLFLKDNSGYKYRFKKITFFEF